MSTTRIKRRSLSLSGQPVIGYFSSSHPHLFQLLENLLSKLDKFHSSTPPSAVPSLRRLPACGYSSQSSVSPPLGSVCWMTSCLIKAPDHPEPHTDLLPRVQPPPRRHQIQGLAAVGVTFLRLPQMKEGSRIIFCLSCPYLSLAPVCFKLHGRATLRRIRVEDRTEEKE